MRVTYRYGCRNVADYLVSMLVQSYRDSECTEDWENCLINYLHPTSLILPGPNGYQLYISNTGYIVLCYPDAGMVCRVSVVSPNDSSKIDELWLNPSYAEEVKESGE